ncbi:MXAN_6640 family putative metalloprotease [Polyangium sp. 6x1]|uniref:MXAN_6640 family putative metalloprotease n=1 Tax=Polyangium sp. 6x1 TaxID=3042689 RepID=UPI00248250A6|nr:MXAN_6640 family putative metalloprotease [Polyangium sp. 6x1]MDI1447531.1 MYXO-CTERM sorting domain-containing protein [Polyangium sp. 6x1]
MRAARLVAMAALSALAACGPEGAAPGPLGGDAPSFAPLDRPDTPGNGLQFNFEPGDVVETFGSPGGKFLIHYTLAGTNAVPTADADGSGAPDFVEQVASVYDEVLGHYEAMGFRPPQSDEGQPDNGGDGRFDVYLVDFAGIGDGVYQTDTCGLDKPGQCTGYMVQENDYKGYGYPSTLVANRILGSHEFFHAVQAAYDRDQGSIFNEGTAVWATEAFDPTLPDFEAFIDGYLDNTDRSLDVPLPGPVDPFSYGSAIFFQFLEERYGDGTVRALVEKTEDGVDGVADPVWFDVLDPTLTAAAGASFPEAFADFATWNLFTAQSADPTRGYANGAKYAPVKMEGVAAPYTDVLRVFYASTQYYRVATGARGQMTAALATPDDAADQVDGLALLVTTRAGTTIGPVVRALDVRAGVDPIDTSSADDLVVVVVNTAPSGTSRKPTLCVGTPDEVDACKTAVQNPGSGSGGGGGSGGGSGSGSGGGEPGDPGGDCGCAFSPAPAGPGLAALGALVLLGHRRARRRKARPASITP